VNGRAIALVSMVALIAVAPGETWADNGWYRLAGAVIEGYKRRPADFAASEQDAIDKARADCARYSDQVSGALDLGLREEHEKCRMDTACDRRVHEEYNRLAKRLSDQLKALCACTEVFRLDCYVSHKRHAPKP